MPSGRGYLQFILDQLSDLEEVDCRPMMGEFILYYRGKIVGGVYDDRLLVRPTKSALARMPEICANLLDTWDGEYPSFPARYSSVRRSSLPSRMQTSISSTSCCTFFVHSSIAIPPLRSAMRLYQTRAPFA